MTDDEEEIFLDLCITVYRRYESIFLIEFDILCICFNSIGDIRSFYLSFSRDICRMRDIEYLNIGIVEFFQYSFSNMDGIFSTFFRSEEYSDISLVRIVVFENSINIIFDYIIGFIIKRNNDDMFQFYCFLLNNIGFEIVFFIGFEEGDI